MAKRGPKGPTSTSFKKGQVANPHGRPVGSKNVVTGDFKAAVANLINNRGDDLNDWIERIAAKNPARAVDCIVALAEFSQPKLSRVTHTGDVNEPVFFKQVEDDIPPDPSE